MYENIVVDNNRVLILGKKNKVYTFTDEGEENIFLRNMFTNIIFSEIELIKKYIDENNNYSYKKLSIYKNEKGKSNIKLVVHSSFIGLIKEILYDNNYTKIKNNQKVLK